jgi:hypothetical protein
MAAPAAKLPNSVDTGTRALVKSHSPPCLPGMLFTTGHFPQSIIYSFPLTWPAHFRRLAGMLMIVAHIGWRERKIGGRVHFQIGTSLNSPGRTPLMAARISSILNEE